MLIAEFGTPAGAPAARADRVGRGAADARGAAADPLPDPARARRAPARVRARGAGGDDAAGDRARSASCRRSSTTPRSAPGCASCGGTCGRSRSLPSGSSILTTFGVALVAHAITDLGWAEAFILGAVVSPTDPTAATAIGRRLGVPRRLIDIVEGESLVNDGMALVLLRTAIVAAVAGSFSAWDAGGRLVLSIVGGIAVGLAIGYVIRRVRRVLDNPPLEVTIAFLTGYLAFLPATALGVSGVLAVVTAGVYMGWYTPELTTVQTRLVGVGFWEVVDLPAQRPALRPRRAAAAPGARRALRRGRLVARRRGGGDRARRDRAPDRRGSSRRPTSHAGSSRGSTSATPSPPLRYPAFVAWNGMRGAVTIAAALLDPARTPTPARLSRARPDHLLRVRGRARHARRPGPDAAGADPRAASRGGRRRRRGRRGARASPRRRGGARAAGRARERGVGAGRHRRAAARPVPVPHRPLLGA